MQSTEAIRGRLSSAFGSVSGKASDLTGRLGTGGMRNVWIALGVGLVASQLVGRSGKSRRWRSGRYATSTSSPRSTLSYGSADIESRDYGMPAL